MISLIFYLFVGAFTLYIILPFFDKSFRNRRVDEEFPEKEELAFRKDEILGALNDLEYDFQMKKISEPDYLQLREKLTQNYINIKKKLDQVSKPSVEHHAAGVGKREREKQHIGS